MSRSHVLAGCLLGCLALLVGAEGTTAAQPVACSIVHVQDLRFGEYQTRTIEPLDTAATILFRCPGVSQVRMELSRGSSGSFQRSMRVRDSVMEYNLYLDAGHSRIWGDGSSGTNVYTSGPTGNGVERVSIFGRVPPRQNLRGGEYRDQLVLTMLY
jgi:spore coat protein U-like protein